LTEWLECHRQEIESGELVVFYQDECHLLWGDVCGYIWGKTNERVEVPMTNERERQTYFGAVNIATGQCLIQAHKKGDGEHTIQYLEYLISQCNNKRIALIWDGAKYHCSAEVKNFLSLVNNGLNESKWKITCLKFAPNDPTQNPIEDIWLQAKRWIRECYHLCKTLATVKYIFEFVTHCQIFDFPKLYSYGKFSRIK
jgi:transposase